MGADHVIHPEMEAATAIVNLLHAPYATYALELDQGKIQIIGVRLDRSSPLINHSLHHLTQNGLAQRPAHCSDQPRTQDAYPPRRRYSDAG